MGRWLAILLLLAGADPAPAETDPPARVVSLNLCTDQLAMLLAAPGQLVSVSWLARDPRASAMVTEARDYPVNHGQAEEVLLLAPDLVLVGTYTAGETAVLLEQLGFAVERFAPANSLQDIRARLRQMGRALGRELAAEAAIAAFDRQLAALEPGQGPSPRLAVLHANGYTSGNGTLVDAIVRAAGFRNLAAELGYQGIVRLPLEELVLARPDAVVVDGAQGGPALAEAVLAHPALRAVRHAAAGLVTDPRNWACGTPKITAAIARLTALRVELAGQGAR